MNYLPSAVCIEQGYRDQALTETNISRSHLSALSPQSECLEQANFWLDL